MKDRSTTSQGRRCTLRLAAYLGVFSLVAAAAVADAGFSGARAHAQAPAPSEPTKGPVGWEAYRDIGAMPQLRGGEQSRQFSSYDRTGGNDDGFNGTYSCLSETERGCVIAEHTGPGEISSIWSTREPLGDVSATGNIVVELDGRVVLDAPLVDVVSGRVGGPFEWPLVGNAEDAVGGVVIKVPMPYRESMRVTVTNNPHFYHVNNRVFPNADGVSTFDPNDPATDVLEKMRNFGVADPKGPTTGTPVRREFDVAPGGSAAVAELTGPARINRLRLRLPQVVPAPQVVDDGRAYGAGGGSSFRMRVDPNNQGVRLVRRFDPQVADQVAGVSVNGVPVGEWRSGPARPGEWGVQVIDVPPEVTAGQSSIEVANRFTSSSLDVNEFRYDVHSFVGGDWERTDVLDLGPSHPGEESAHGYAIDNPVFERWQLSGRYPHDPAQVAASDEVLAGARVRITFDGQTTVDAPIGEFFGSGLGEHDVRTMMSSIDPGLDGWYTAWWPMPFDRSAEVEIVNGSGQPITGATAEVVAGPGGPGPDDGLFHATHKRGATVPGQDWNFLDTGGAGTFYGVTHTMRGHIPLNAARSSALPHSVRAQQANPRNYLEGDERFYVDGAAEPAWHGTGTEDFYESGWYFRFGTTFSMPQAGNPAHEVNQDGCRYDCTGAYRLMLGEAVPFRTGLRAGIEHGPANDEPGEYSSTAYWYGAPAGRGLPLPAPPPGPEVPPSLPPAQQPPAEPPSAPVPTAPQVPPEPGQDAPERPAPTTRPEDGGLLDLPS
ncbi:glycoside hydrolase family 172 protein [Saccharopolyspora griseoalba]|uniref:Glycoside hydrolase family 172 protein n=1 Tax=Saccharopolyspora griseoalba TaxID=1431848 RepID=A0ABW2LTK8_9PSEU